MLCTDIRTVGWASPHSRLASLTLIFVNFSVVVFTKVENTEFAGHHRVFFTFSAAASAVYIVITLVLDQNDLKKKKIIIFK
jgi:hypothetical protein